MSFGEYDKSISKKYEMYIEEVWDGDEEVWDGDEEVWDGDKYWE